MARTSLNQWFSPRSSALFSERLAMSGNLFACHNWGIQLAQTGQRSLLIIAILMGKKWYLIVSFTCIEHSSLCLLAIFISS